ncbi:hypothetical protein ASF69_01505 [Rhizobium sp. Leaf311]|nr:hypothetical protein ASF69_01505 [Rhizobium sp. Leaf311]
MLAWIGFVGLLLDFVGVVILTLDILPEFRLHRRERRLRQLRLNSQHLNDGDGAYVRREGDEVLRTTEAALAMVRASNASLYDLQRFDALTARSALNSSAYDFEAIDDPRIKTALKDQQFSRSNFESALTALEEKAAAAQANLAGRRRPNLFLGVVFVLLGFASQAFGAMPPYAQQATIGFIINMLAPAAK